VLSKEQTESNGCRDLFRYFGGELARHALHALADELFPVLASVGIPCVVEARLSIWDAQPHHLSALADEFIQLGWQMFLGQTYQPRGCDMMITHPVTPDRILDVWEKAIAP
jgi:hypothetical protein